MNVGIPKRLGHIWIGPKSPPQAFLDSWKACHPDWDYTLYGNEFLKDFTFRTQKQIDEYWRRGQYHGVADLMRYEILFEYGGFVAPADAECLKNTDELFPRACAYTVYENEFLRGKLVSPILACEPKNPFVGMLIDYLANFDPKEFGEPWMSTGNLLVAQLIEKHEPDVIVFPSHYLIPEHYTGVKYEGPEEPYARQGFFSTNKAYAKARGLSALSELMKKNYRNKMKRR